MYFMPHANWLCRLCAPLKSSHRYGITVLFLLCVWYAWYYGIYSTIAQRIASNEYVIQQSKMQCQQTFEETETMLKAVVTDARAALYDHNSAWKNEGFVILLDYIEQSGLEFISSDIATKNNAVQQYVQDSVTLHAIGTLKQCSHFFSLLIKSPVQFVCEQIDIVAIDHARYTLSCVITVVTVPMLLQNESSPKNKSFDP